MIKKLTDKDHAQTMQFLSQEQAFNLFIIGDIEAFGFDTDFQEIWGDFSQTGELRAVLLRFYHNYIPYGIAGFDAGALVEIINWDSEFEALSGKVEVAEQFGGVRALASAVKDTLFFAELQVAQNLQIETETSHNLGRVKKAELCDLDRILELREQIPSFTRSASNRESLQQSMQKGISRTFYIEDMHGRMIAAASTAAENSLSAMVVGVCTLPDYRKQGFASLCMTALCTEVLAEGRSLCLFYNNPEAGAIYKRLGFQDIGHWCMYKTANGA